MSRVEKIRCFTYGLEKMVTARKFHIRLLSLSFAFSGMESVSVEWNLFHSDQAYYFTFISQSSMLSETF